MSKDNNNIDYLIAVLSDSTLSVVKADSAFLCGVNCNFKVKLIEDGNAE